VNKDAKPHDPHNPRKAAFRGRLRPLDRRIYEIVRKHCGQQAKWRVSFEVLQKKSGSNSPAKKFAFYLRHLAHSNHLPDYALTLEDGQVVFWKRAERIGSANQPRIPTATPGASPPSERRIMVSSKAIEQLYEFVPGWDKYMLESMYIEWAKDKEGARDEDARFLSWVRSYTKGKPSP
jgi:hypothetical protein